MPSVIKHRCKREQIQWIVYQLSSRSTLIAFVFMAIIGTWWSRTAEQISRVTAVAWKPSISGIITSIPQHQSYIHLATVPVKPLYRWQRHQQSSNRVYSARLPQFYDWWGCPRPKESLVRMVTKLSSHFKCDCSTSASYSCNVSRVPLLIAPPQIHLMVFIIQSLNDFCHFPCFWIREYQLS